MQLKLSDASTIISILSTRKGMEDSSSSSFSSAFVRRLSALLLQ